MSGTSDFVVRDCPLCGTRPTSPTEVSTAPKAESMSFEKLIQYWNGFFKDRVFFSYHRCASCGLLFAPIFFSDEQLARLYGQMPPNMESIPPDALRKTQRGYFEFLRKHNDLKGAYLEVGPDIGLIVENCVRDGDFDAYWLYEPNRAVAPALAAAVGDRPHRLIHEMTGFEAAPAGSVGAVAMIHVLDHLLEPVGVLRDLRRTMRLDSAIVIVTHNERSLLRKIFGRRWPAFCLQHPQVYNPNSITALLQRSGFDVLEIRRTTNYFPLSFLLMHLLWAIGIKAKRAPGLGSLTLGLKLGNMITVAKPRAEALPS